MDSDRDARPDEDSRIGRRLDQRYRIERRLGSGASGVVFEARHEEMDRLVAIKVLRGDLFKADATLERFRREARTAGRLRHPNVVTVHDFGRSDDGEPFLVMELCEGGSLADRMSAGSVMPVEEVLAIFAPVASAVANAHRLGILHRDLKPANVLFAAGVPKVADFGLARMIGDEDSRLTMGNIVGSPAYMSPEQCSEVPALPASDVYSLGIMLFEALAGKLPVASPTLSGILIAHLTHRLLDLATERPQLPQPIVDLVARCLERQPEDRFAHGEELEAALHALRPELARIPGITVGRGSAARVRRQEAARERPIGREAELATLFADVVAARAGRGRLVTIAGEPGVGKSTLLRGFLAETADAQPEALIALGQCSEHFGKSEAYLPFFDALGSLLASESREHCEQVLRTVGPTWASQLPILAPSPSAGGGEGSGGLRDRMPRELGDALGPLAGTRGLILALEDLHWADEASVDLLAYLAPRLSSLPVLVVATYRPEDVERTGHPVRQLLRRLRGGHGAFAEIVPRALAGDDLRALVGRELGGSPSPALVQLVAQITEGNPLFAVNAVRHLVEAEAVREEGGNLELAAPAEELAATVPRGLAGLLEEKIERLDLDERMLLQAASVLGESFESTVVARLVSRDELEVEESLAEIARRHRLIELVGEIDYPAGFATARFRFAHALYENAIYASVLSRRRELWHRRAADTLRDLYGERIEPIAVALAVHLERARDLPAAIDAFVTAADLLGRANPRDARPLLESAHELAERLAGDEARARRVELLVRLARHDVESAELVGDVSLYDRAERLVEAALELEPTSDAARTILGLVHLERGSNLAAFEDFAGILRRNPVHGPAWDGLAYLFKNTGMWEQALQAAERAGACEPRLAHSIRRLSALLFLGRIEEALAEAEALVAARPRFSHYSYWRGIAAFYAGDGPGCRSWVERGYGLDPEDQIGQGVLAFVLASEGESRRARELVRSAEQGALADGTFTYWIGSVYAVLGDHGRALDWIRRAADLGYWNAPWMAEDPAIESLRRDPDFPALLADVAARQQAFATAVADQWTVLVATPV